MEKQTPYVYCPCQCNYLLKDEAKHLQGPFHTLWLNSKSTPAPVIPPRKNNRNVRIACECGLTYTQKNKARHNKDPRHQNFFCVSPAIEAIEAIEGNTALEKWASFASNYIIHIAVSKKYNLDCIDMTDKALYNKNIGEALHNVGFVHFLKSRSGVRGIVEWHMLSFSKQIEYYQQKAKKTIASYNRRHGVLADISTLQLSTVSNNEHSLSASFFNEHSHKEFPETGIFLKKNFPEIFEKKLLFE